MCVCAHSASGQWGELSMCLGPALGSERVPVITDPAHWDTALGEAGHLPDSFVADIPPPKSLQSRCIYMTIYNRAETVPSVE